MITSHWIEVIADVRYGANFRLVCEHPQNCAETATDARPGCAVKDFFDDAGLDLLSSTGDQPELAGRFLVRCAWSGSGEDTELSLLPMRPALTTFGAGIPDAQAFNYA